MPNVKIIQSFKSVQIPESLLQCKHTSLQLPNGENCHANIESICRCLFHEDFNARDAIEDVKALRKILFSSLVLASEQSFTEAKSCLSAMPDRIWNFLTKGLISCKHLWEVCFLQFQQRDQFQRQWLKKLLVLVCRIKTFPLCIKHLVMQGLSEYYLVLTTANDSHSIHDLVAKHRE